MMGYAEDLAEAFGYMTVKEVKLLKRVATEYRSYSPVFINIGAGAGTSTLAMREAVPYAMIYSVDTSPGGPLGGLEGERNAFKNAGRELPVQILGDSGNIGKHWDHERKADLIFIDDGHLEDDVIRDINCWMPHLDPHGYILFHDYGAERWPDVRKVALHYMTMNNFQLYALADTLAVFIGPRFYEELP